MTRSDHPEPPVCAGPDLRPRKAAFRLPAGAADCHAHVFGRRERYGYASDRQYTPPPVFSDDYLRMLEAVGFTRGVIVQSGVHGTRNDVLLDTIAASPQRLRGIALLDPDVSDSEVERLHAGGVRGFRVNVVSGIGVQFEAARALAARVKHLGWHVQLLLDIERFPDFDGVAAAFPTDIVVDHMGRPDPSRDTGAPGFQALLRALQGGRVWSKLSAPYRTSRTAFPYADMTSFARALIETAPDRLVYGSDWPHVMLDSAMPNDGALADLLLEWVPDPAVRERILVANPARLYDFAPAG